MVPYCQSIEPFLRPRQLEFLERLGLGIEPREVAAKIVAEPDHALRIDLQAARPRIGIGRGPFGNFVRFHIHFADAVMIAGIELGKPYVPLFIQSDAVNVRDFGEECEFLGFNIDLAEGTAGTPDISL